MEAGFIALAVLMCVICTVVGIHIGKRKAARRDIQGALNVDCSDPESNPYLYLQLDVPIEEVTRLKQATFVVHVFK